MRNGEKFARGIYLTAFLSSLFIPSISFSHDSSPDSSHIDVYYDTDGTGAFNLTCPAGGGEAAPGGNAQELRDTNTSAEPNQSTFAIDYAQASPRSAVMLVIRNQTWTGAAANCGAATLDLTIKRRRLSGTPPTLKLEDVRKMSYSNIATAGACPLNFCVQWNGDIPVDETGFGRVNGTYEFEVELSSVSTENTLKVKLAYPGEGQLPVKVDATDIHSVVSSPTVVGSAAAFPVLVNYKLSKSVQTTIDVFKGTDQGCTMDLNTASGNNTDNLHGINSPGCTQHVRRLVNNQPRWGEDTTQGKLGNVDTWDGRDVSGNLVSSGTYVVTMTAWDPDSYINLDGDADITEADTHNHDQSFRSSFTVTMDPMQIADLAVQPLTSASTAFAGISFQLTEPATVYWDIWQSSADLPNNQSPPVVPSNNALLIRHLENTFPAKTPVSMIWDGKDKNGNFVGDANYKFSLWAQEAKEGGISTSTIRTATARIGSIPISRGLVPISQISVIPGSFGNPLVSGVAPYLFNYSMGRDANVSLKVIAQNGQFINSSCSPSTCASSQGCLIAQLVNNEVRNGSIVHAEPPTGGWDGRTSGLGAAAICPNGVRVASGTYSTELNAQDTLFTNRVSTITSLFAVDQLRTANVSVTPLLSGTTDSVSLSYILSESMTVRWTIYPPATTFTGSWPNLTASSAAVRTIFGPRPGRLKVTEFWDGRNDSGLFVADGNYMSTLSATDASNLVATDQVIKELVVARGQIAILSPLVAPTFPTLESSSATLKIPIAPFEIGYTLSRDANVTVAIKTQDGVFITSLTNSEPRSGGIINKEFWDGTNFTGVRLTTASLFVDILAQDQASVAASSSVARLPLAVNLLRIFDVAVTPLTPGGDHAEISYQLSEAMSTSLRIYKPGTVFNAAGSPVPPEEQSLVFRVTGARPGRVNVTENWPGINLFQKQVQDGNYVFRLSAMDENGNQAADVITGQVSSLRLGFADPQSTLDDQTFAYPNPAVASPVKICTLVPIDSTLNLKLYSLSGELVWQKEIGFRPGGTSLCGSSAILWNLDNTWGRRVARGVYFYVLRADSVGGDRQFIQTRKKILVP